MESRKIKGKSIAKDGGTSHDKSHDWSVETYQQFFKINTSL